MRPSEEPGNGRTAGGAGNGAAGERQGIQPRYRRAFGCVTWTYMGILAFLAAATLFAFPLRYLGDGAGFGRVLSLLSFFGLVLILPAMILAFILGARTYRVTGIFGRRAGALIGGVIGWTCYFFLCWAAVAYGFGGRDQLFRPTLFGGLEDSLFLYVFPLPVLAATALVFFALYFPRSDYARRRQAVVLATALAAFAGLGVVAFGFDVLGVLGAVVSTAAGAAGGWVSGAGYARAGGEEMIPPGATIRPREPRAPRGGRRGESG